MLLTCLPVASLRLNGGSLEPGLIASLGSKAATMSFFALIIAPLSSTGRVFIQSRMPLYCSLRDIVALLIGDVLVECRLWLLRVVGVCESKQASRSEKWLATWGFEQRILSEL